LDAGDAEPVPSELVAVTLKVYESPLLRPITVQVSGPVVHVQVCPPFAEEVESAAVTVYSVMFAPPGLVGALQVTVAEASATVATTLRGAPGTVAAGVAQASSEGLEGPIAFTASTVK
jgi:hypothetical protein